MDNQTESKNEIDLIEIAQYLLSSWKSLAVTTVAGCLVGVITAFVLPPKFGATTNLKGATVLGKELEPPTIVRQRLLSPSIYSDKTLSTCDLQEFSDPALAAIKMITVSIPRDTSVLEVVVRASSRKSAQDCLVMILGDLRNSQKSVFNLQFENASLELEQIKKELATFRQRKMDKLALNQSELNLTMKKLKDVNEFLNKAQMPELSFDLSDQKFSASSLLSTAILEKQKEAYQLENKIDELRQSINSKIVDADTEEQVAKLEREVAEKTNSLRAPETVEAENVTPIYSPIEMVQPRKPLMVLLGTVIGAFVGLLYLLLYRLKLIYQMRRREIRM